MQLILVFISAALVNNFVLARSLAICPFIGVSKTLETSVGMSAAVTFVMVLATAFTHTVFRFLLAPFGLEYLRIIVFVLIIAALVQVVEMFLRKKVPALYQSLGIFLPLITTNCAVFALVLLNVEMFAGSLIYALVHAFGAAAGFAVAIVLFCGIRERLEGAEIPRAFKGMPIVMIVAGLMSVAFLGFVGMINL